MSGTTSQQRAASPRYEAETRSTPEAGRARAAARPRLDRSIVTRIVVPVVVALGTLAVLSQSSGVTSLMIFVAAWFALGIVALVAGYDSREASGWTRRQWNGNGDRHHRSRG